MPKPAKGAEEKVAIARRLRRETTLTCKWMAEKLVMGSWTTVANLLAPKPENK